MRHIYSIKGIAEEQDDYQTQVNDYKADLLKVYEKSNDLFEKQLSYISAGALGLTFVLIEKVIKDFANAKLIGLIIGSWILLALSLCVNLASHLYTSNCHYKTIRDIDTGSLDGKVANRRNKRINLINLLSIVSLFLGIFCFILFTSYNVFNMKKRNIKNNVEMGTKNIPDTPTGIPKPTAPPPINPGTGLPATPPPIR